MEPLGAGDPTEVAGCSLVGRLWAVGPLRSFVARRDGETVELQFIDRSGTAYDVDHIDADRRTRLESASAELADIVHPALPKVLDSGVDDARLWLVLSGAGGSTLGDGLVSGQPLGSRDWQRLSDDMLGALGVVHRAGWALGQLSPQLISRSAVGSFTMPSPGLAALLRKVDLPSPGLLAGSIMWLAPEQLRQADPTPASDLFVAGAILAYAGTGRPPWGEAGAPTSQIVQRLSSMPPDTQGLTFEQRQQIALLTAKGPEYRSAEVPSPTAPSQAASAPAPSTAPSTAPPLLSPHGEVSAGTPGSGVDPVAGSHDDVSPSSNGRVRVLAFAGGGALVVAAIVVIVLLMMRGGADSSAQAPGVTASAESTEAAALPSAGQSSDPSTDPALGSPSPLAPPTLTTRVDYKPDAVPDATFEGTATWEASLCIGDPAFGEGKYLDRVRLDRKGVSGWSDTEAKATSTKPGRCQEAGQFDVRIGFTEPVPREAAINEGWSDCHAYRVVIPETPRRRGTAVDLCVTIRADRP